MIRSDILAAINREREYQINRWDEAHDPNPADKPWLAILMEEVGEVAQETLDGGTKAGLRQELIQVAAVCVKWLEQLY